jgi:hypothetical protein
MGSGGRHKIYTTYSFMELFHQLLNFPFINTSQKYTIIVPPEQYMRNQHILNQIHLNCYSLFRVHCDWKFSIPQVEYNVSIPL